MGGGAIWPPVTASTGGATYTRSTSLGANFQSHQSPSVMSRAPCVPSSTHSIGLAEACSENLPSFDVDDNLDLTSFEGRQNMAAKKPYIDLGLVPTRLEAENAMADLQRFMQSETYSDMDGIQSMVSSSESRTLQSAGYGKRGLPDALNMLQNDPLMQSTVVSISCDKAVWDAILSNRAVQDLRGSLSAAGEEKLESSSKEFDIVDVILNYLTGITKSKVVELIEKFGALVAEIFKPADKAKPTSELNDLVEEKIRSSFLLSVVILLIVIVTRN